ncbi:MAG: choice-of-anchor P family protein [Actinomycetota bacterium]|nr:DUF11 domain-containing protein [Actinomycetota bacterium]
MRSCLLFAVCAASLVSSAPAQASLPDLRDAGVSAPSQPQAPKPSVPTTNSSNKSVSNQGKAVNAPAALALDFQALSAKVATGGQAIFRATATSGSSVSNLTFEATLPAGFAYNRTLGASKNNTAIASTATPAGQKITWIFGGSDSTLDANGSIQVIFVATAPPAPSAVPASISMKVSSGGGAPSDTKSVSVTVTNTAVTIELDDSPFVVGDQNNVGTSIPRVATLGVRIINPTAISTPATIKIGNGTTAGTFSGATFTNPASPTCSTISGGLGMLALERHGATGATTDATRAITAPPGVTTLFFPLCYNQLQKNVRLPFTVWSDTAGSAPANGEVTVDSNISASANKINIPITGGRVGDVITMTVNYDLGTIGSIGSAWLQAAGSYAFDPHVSRLRSLTATLPGVTTTANRAYYVGLPHTVNGASVTYTFDVIGFGQTAFAPYQFAASGANLKYTGNFGTSETILTPPNLSIAKKQRKNPVDATTPTFTDQDITVGPGDVIEYQLTIANSGQQAATGVNISDAVPANTTYVANSANESGALNGSNIEWTNKTVAANSSLVLTFRVTVNPTVPFSFQVKNTASVTSTNGGHPTSNEVVANGSGSVDLSITKDCPTSVVLGETATYTLHYANSGASSATGVKISDTLSAGQTYFAGSTTNGQSEPTGTNPLVFTIGTVSAGASSSFSFKVTISSAAGSSVTDQATISGDQTDVNTANNTSAQCSVPVTSPDLHIAKTCPTTPVLGEQASYTITYSNNGSASDSAVTITDTLGANQTFDSATGDFTGYAADPYNSSKIIFQIANLAANSATFSITVTVNVTGTGTLANSVVIGGARAERSADTTDNSANCSATIKYADLFVNKTCPTSGLYGDDISYSVDYGNLGTASAPGAVLTDVLSAGQSYNGDASLEPFSVTENEDGTTTIIWHLGELSSAPAGGTITFTAHITDQGDVSNRADIAGSRAEHDTTANNNHSQCGTQVTHVDLFITKTCPTAPVLGEDATYTIHYGNNGSADATVVRITDVLPAGQTYVDNSTVGAGEPQQDGQKLTFAVSNVEAGDTDNTLSFKVHVTATGTLANSASISSHETDGNPADNTGSCTSEITQPDLSVSHTCPAAANPGDTLNETIGYANNGTANDSGVDVTLVLGDGLTFGNSSTPHTVDGQTVTFTIGDLAAGASGSISYTVEVRDIDTAGEHSLTQAVSIDGDRDEAPGTLANNEASCATSVTYTPNLFIQKTCPGTVVLGEDASYSISYGNSGTAPSNDVTITDTLGAGQSYVSGSTVGTAEPNVTSNVLTFTIGTVNPSNSGAFSFKVHVTAPGSIDNTAAINGTEAETDNANNSASCSSNVTQPDLYVSKTCRATANPGDTLTETITYGNSGTATDSGVAVTLVLGDGLTFGDSQTAHSVDGQTVTFTIGTLAANTGNQTITYTVHVRDIDDAGEHSLTQAVSIDGDRDEAPDALANNEASCATSVTYTPNLFIQKTCPGTVVLGEDGTYTIRYGNSGTAPSNDVTITDTLGAGQSYIEGSTVGTDEPDVTGNVLTFTIGTVSPNGTQSESFSFKVHVTAPGSIDNTAAINGTEAETDNANNTASCSSTVTQPDVTLVKDCPATANPGQTVEHTLTYGNAGTADALNVVISDELGDGLTFVDSSAPHTVDGPNVTFNIGTIPAGTAGETITYTVRIASVDSAGAHTFSDSASISGSRTEVDTSNNSDDCDTAITFRPDLNITKDTSDANVSPGSVITYTITVTNPAATSSAPATGTTVSDTLPEGITYDSCGGAECSETGGVVTWNVGTVDVGQTVTLNLSVNVGFDAGCQICNTASVSSPDDPDSPVVSAEKCIGTTPQGNPANANASGSATGLSLSLLGSDPTKLAEASSQQHGIGVDAPEATPALPVSVPGIASVNILTSTSSSDVNGTLRSAHTTATSTLAGVNLLDGAITADVARAVSSVTTTENGVTVSALGSTIENLKINGELVDDVTPNQRVELTDADGNVIGYVVLFEQLTTTDTPDELSGGTYTGSLTVNMIHVFLGVVHPLGDGPGTELIVSSANAASDFPQAELCSQGSARTADAGAFAVHAIIPGSDGHVVEILKGASGPVPPSGGEAHQNLVNFVTAIAKGASESNARGATGNPVTANAYDEVTRLDLLDGTITADVLRSESSSTADAGGASSNADGTKFLSLTIKTGEEPQTFENTPGPNQEVINVPDVGFVILNEQLTSNGDGTSELTVTSIHLFVTLENVLGVPVGTEIWVSQARTATEFHLPTA